MLQLRCEAVVAAMSQELDAGGCLLEHVPADFIQVLVLLVVVVVLGLVIFPGRQRAAQLASEAAQARQRKEHFGAAGV